MTDAIINTMVGWAIGMLCGIAMGLAWPAMPVLVKIAKLRVQVKDVEKELMECRVLMKQVDDARTEVEMIQAQVEMRHEILTVNSFMRDPVARAENIFGRN